jgi:hypothetical protein
LLLRRGLRLEYATLAWNVFGGVLVLAAAVAARSVALAGFGLDGLIEIAASAGVVWQLKGSDKTRETKALRLIGIAFILLAFYIGAQSTYVLAAGVPNRCLGVHQGYHRVVMGDELSWLERRVVESRCKTTKPA